MPKLVTDIRQLKKLQANVATQQPVVDKLSSVAPINTDRQTPLGAALVRLQAAYPALKLLIDTLDLELTHTALPPGHARLWELAGQSLDGGAIYSRSEAIERIRLKTSVNKERAEKGFDLMLESKAIEPIIDAHTGQPHPNLFYLGGSTPF